MLSSALTKVSWAPTEELQLSEWSAVGRRFGEIARCSQWWLGDWIRYGNTKFGERYTRAAALTGYDVQSLMNMVHVASRFEIYRRRENLSWSHHATLAPLDPDVQAYWLDRATEEHLSVADLRIELQGWRRSHKEPADDHAENDDAADDHALSAPINSYRQLSPPSVIVCPRCGHKLGEQLAEDESKVKLTVEQRSESIPDPAPIVLLDSLTPRSRRHPHPTTPRRSR
jgi:hypothetical protein